MKILTALGSLQTFLSAFTASSNTTYNVVSLTSTNQTIGVVIDNRPYPLSASPEVSSLLFTGQAPVAKQDYHYAHMSNDGYTIISQENFTRLPVQGSDKTLNEYYGRSWNSKKLNSIPKLMEPLSCIHRIASDLHIDGEIPTIHFFGNQTLIDFVHAHQLEDIKIKLNMTYISPREVKHYPKVTFAISGHSTRFNAKVSYKFKVPKGDSLFGYRHIKLRSISTDKTFMRDHLAYSIAESIGLPSSKHSYVRVYINRQAVGLFGLAEVFKEQWVQNQMALGDKNKRLGTLFVADVSGGQKMGPPGNGPPPPPPPPPETYRPDKPLPDHPSPSPPRSGPPELNHGKNSDLSYLGNDTAFYDKGYYSVKANPTDGRANFTRLMELTRFISEQFNLTEINDSVVPQWQQRIDMDSLLRMIAFEIVISNSDAYLTMANNYILYDDYETDRMVFSAQDFDLTMGSAIHNATLLNNGNYTAFPGFLSRPVTLSFIRVPKFKKDLERLMYTIVKGLVNTKMLSLRIESLRDFLLEDVVWDQGLPRLGSPKGRPGHDTDSAIDPEDSFLNAIYGPTNITHSMALLEWLEYRSTQLLNFLEDYS